MHQVEFTHVYDYSGEDESGANYRLGSQIPANGVVIRKLVPAMFPNRTGWSSALRRITTCYKTCRRDFRRSCVGRSLDGIIRQYYDTVRPMHHEYLEATRQFADLIVGEETDIAADVLAARVGQILNEN